MCNLQTHMDRDHRIHEAQRAEPVYTKLAAEYGIEYEPPTLTTFAEEIYSLSGGRAWLDID